MATYSHKPIKNKVLNNSNGKCGEITFCAQVGKRVYALNCLYCSQICLQWDMFINHMEQMHDEELNFDYSLQSENDETELQMDYFKEGFIEETGTQHQILNPPNTDLEGETHHLDDPLEEDYSMNPSISIKEEAFDVTANQSMVYDAREMVTNSQNDEEMSLPNVNCFTTQGCQAIPQYNKEESQCQDCSNLKALFEERFKEINNTIQKLQEIIVNQNDIIMKAMVEQKVLTERVLHQEVTNDNVRTVFPIKSLRDLIELNNTISEDNHELYVNVMKSLLKGRLSKTLTEVISVSVCTEINMDGIHGKKRLRDFKAFFQSLTDACRSLGSNEVEKDIREALKIIKKRHFHAECIRNKKINKITSHSC